METKRITNSANSVQINIPFNESADRRLNLAVGACRIKITPGEGEAWVTGTYYGPIEVLPLEIIQTGGEVKITQRQEWAEITRLIDGPPTLELALGKAMPYALNIDTGASESILDLGGLPLSRFSLKQGAGKVVADFSAANPGQMDSLTASSGASGIDLTNLANANFGEMRVEGGAVAYKLDFGGALRRDARVKVSAAMSSTEIIVPSSTAAKIGAQTIMGAINVGNGFMRKDAAYWTEAALAGTQPTLSMQVEVTMGSLNLYSK
jgi:hypothetical protein